MSDTGRHSEEARDSEEEELRAWMDERETIAYLELKLTKARAALDAQAAELQRLQEALAENKANADAIVAGAAPMGCALAIANRARAALAGSTADREKEKP